ncbi:MAG: hypothetical protein PHT95_07770, partial [Candidatus Omnitrophica bacterium]|nr:hypothetical protein [Candidatus Omnitrophota bacterium]
NAAYRLIDYDRDFGDQAWDSSYSTVGWDSAGALYERLDGDGNLIETDIDEKVGNTIQIKTALLTSSNYNAAADLNKDMIVDSADLAAFEEALSFYGNYIRSDINGDGIVDAKDMAAFEKGLVVSNTVANQVVNINGTLYDVRYNKDRDEYSIGTSSTGIGGRVISVGGRDYLIFDDIDGEIYLVEKMLSDITGGTGYTPPDGVIDLNDWALINDSLTVAPIRLSPLAYNSRSQGWVASGETVKSPKVTVVGGELQPASITYRLEVLNEYEEGYDFGILFRTEDDMPPAGHKYEFELYVDGMEVKAAVIETVPSAGYIQAYATLSKDLIPLGTHDIKIVIKNTKDQIEIKEVFLRKADYRGDLDSNGFIDMADYDIFMRQFATSYNVYEVQMPWGADYTTAYIIRQHDGTSDILLSDRTMIKTYAGGMLADMTVNGEKVTYRLTGPEENDPNLYLSRINSADLNRDGVVDWRDGMILKHGYIYGRLGAEASDPSSNEGWIIDGDMVVSGTMNKKVEYQLDAGYDGDYYVGAGMLDAKGLTSGSFSVAVYVDGELEAMLSVEKDAFGAKEFSIPVYLVEGGHLVAFEWVGGDYTSQSSPAISEVFMFDASLDLSGDGLLNGDDITVFAAQKISTSDLVRVTVGEDAFYISRTYDGAFAVYDDSYDLLAVSEPGVGLARLPDGRELRLGVDVKDGIIAFDRLSQDTNLDGTVDALDRARLVSQAALGGFIVNMDSFEEKSGDSWRYEAGTNNLIALAQAGYTTSNEDVLGYSFDTTSAGTFEIGFNFDGFTSDGILADYAAHFTITVDGNKKNVRLAQGSSRAEAVFTLGPGEHTIEIAWVNRDKVATSKSLAFTGVFVRDARYEPASDLNTDGVVSQTDVDLWDRKNPSETSTFEISAGEKTYFAVKLSSGGVVLFDETGISYETRLGGTVWLDNVEYVVSSDAATRSMALSPRVVSDLNADGFTDLGDLSY